VNVVPSAPRFLYVVVSDSITPTINKGDIVIAFSPSSSSQLQKLSQPDIGQIVVISSPTDGQIFVHRIIDAKIIDGKQFFITKGDDNPSADSFPIPKSKVIGIVQFIIPYAGIIFT
jgi:signal peptidase I